MRMWFQRIEVVLTSLADFSFHNADTGTQTKRGRDRHTHLLNTQALVYFSHPLCVILSGSLWLGNSPFCCPCVSCERQCDGVGWGQRSVPHGPVLQAHTKHHCFHVNTMQLPLHTSLSFFPAFVFAAIYFTIVKKGRERGLVRVIQQHSRIWHASYMPTFCTDLFQTVASSKTQTGIDCCD